MEQTRKQLIKFYANYRGPLQELYFYVQCLNWFSFFWYLSLSLVILAPTLMQNADKWSGQAYQISFAFYILDIFYSFFNTKKWLFITFPSAIKYYLLILTLLPMFQPFFVVSYCCPVSQILCPQLDKMSANIISGSFHGAYCTPKMVFSL